MVICQKQKEKSIEVITGNFIIVFIVIEYIVNCLVMISYLNIK